MSTSAPTQRTSDATPVPDSASVLDIKPFRIDWLLLERFSGGAKPDRRMPSTLAVATCWAVLVGLVLLLSAGAQGLLRWTAAGSPLWRDLWRFVLRSNEGGADQQSVPLLRDYPSLVLAATVVTAVGLVYHLFKGASTLHSQMEKAGCINTSHIELHELARNVASMNKTFERWRGKVPALFLLWLFLMVVANLALKRGAFGFLGPGVYENWWASLDPVRPGGIAWVVFGAVGIHMVFVQAILGLTYVRFLNSLKGDKKANPAMRYPFSANSLNPDGSYGWQDLRALITNLQIGAVCTLLSAWAFSYFLEPAFGTLAMIGVLAIFVGVVAYVYFSVTINFRRQVIHDKADQSREVIDEIRARHDLMNSRTGKDHLDEISDYLYLLVRYRKLDYIKTIPTTPLRRSWQIAGLLSLFGTISAIFVSIVQYLAGP